jgi:hypothetical protein
VTSTALTNCHGHRLISILAPLSLPLPLLQRTDQILRSTVREHGDGEPPGVHHGLRGRVPLEHQVVAVTATDVLSDPRSSTTPTHALQGISSLSFSLPHPTSPSLPPSSTLSAHPCTVPTIQRSVLYRSTAKPSTMLINFSSYST